VTIILNLVLAFILLILSGITFFMGNSIAAHSKSAIHEIEGLIFYLMSTIFFTGASLIGAMTRKKSKDQ
jgi:uncharacterized membrane protein YoaK (UPF0700 family)